MTDRDLLAHDESADAPEIANRLTVLSGTDTSTEQVQLDAEIDSADPQHGVVRAYPAPWRTLTLAHTGDAQTLIGARREETTQHEQLLAIAGGEASTQYPVHEVLTAQWRYQDLGAPDIDGTAVRTTGGEPDYGQLLLTYTARCWAWPVHDPRVGSIQFLALEEG